MPFWQEYQFHRHMSVSRITQRCERSSFNGWMGKKFTKFCKKSRLYSAYFVIIVDIAFSYFAYQLSDMIVEFVKPVTVQCQKI